MSLKAGSVGISTLGVIFKIPVLITVLRTSSDVYPEEVHGDRAGAISGMKIAIILQLRYFNKLLWPRG
jgi:hypothetical protein